MLLFKNILIPVDFSISTEIAVKKGIELSDNNGSTIHLLHVVNPQRLGNIISIGNQFISSSNKYYNDNNIMVKLNEWKQSIEEAFPAISVKTWLLTGVVQERIIDIAKQINPQLIIIGKKGNPNFFTFFGTVYPNPLAKSTNCPVLTVMTGSDHSKIKIIVVPIRSFIPKRKIELVAAIAKTYKAKIHLVTSQNKIGNEETNNNAFLETYALLKTGLTNPIEYHILKGNNLPKAMLNYAIRIGADMLIANPSAETKIGRFSGKHINDMLQSSSKLQILSVEPYSGN